MNIGDLVIRAKNSYEPGDCDSGAPINQFGLVVDITTVKSVFILWPNEDGGYIMGYTDDDWSLKYLEVIYENR